jgi:non-specific serine/threonine protein kinase
MDIVQGLLRLRQICCHPLLVDRTFVGSSGKYRQLLGQLDDLIAGGHKVLIFSQFVSALELLRGNFVKRGIRNELLSGKSTNRQNLVDSFQNDPAIPLMLISLKAGGTGLNLTAADYVVHLDPWWNPAAEAQASDRAYRIGQTRPVFVYKMITRNTVEERVLAMQQSKRALFDAVITTENSVVKSLTRQDVVELFS